MNRARRHQRILSALAFGLIAVLVYLVDVRPKLLEIQGKSR